MQSVLSIDTSSSPATAVVVQVEGKRASIQEIHRFEFSAPPPAENADSLGAGAASEHAASSAPSDSLRAVLNSIRTPWTSSILVLAPTDYLSLNLDLPFSSNRDLDKVVDSEVQDLVPFELENYLLHYRALGPRAPSRAGEKASESHDVHVGLLPRAVVGSTLALCKQAGFEPFMVSTPAGVLDAVAYLGNGSIPQDSAIVFARDQYLSVVVLFGGRARVDRVIDLRLLSSTDTTALARELRLTLATAQQRYDRPIERLLWLGSAPPFELGEHLGLPVTMLPAPELVKAADDSTAIACLASVFAQDLTPPPILTNFRVREFSYSPQLRELMRGLRSVVPYALAAALIAILSAIGLYTLREHRIGKLQDALYAEVKKAVPDLEAARGVELDALEGANRKLEQELSNLGSLSAMSPLDYFAEISSDLPLSSGVTVTRVKIEGNKMRVDGTAPDYTAMEKIERALKRKKDIYCRIRKDTTATVPGKPNVRGFSFDIVLCE